MRGLTLLGLALAAEFPTPGEAHRYTAADSKVRVALVQPPFSPTGGSAGPRTTGGLLHGGTAGQLSVDARPRGGTAALRTHQRADAEAFTLRVRAARPTRSID